VQVELQLHPAIVLRVSRGRQSVRADRGISVLREGVPGRGSAPLRVPTRDPVDLAQATGRPEPPQGEAASYQSQCREADEVTRSGLPICRAQRAPHGLRTVVQRALEAAIRRRRAIAATRI
jgi:hypothetical protein